MTDALDEPGSNRRALATPPQSPTTTAHNYADPNDVFNSCRYHTGKPCVEEGCNEPAGTWWSKLWCFAHNVERMAWHQGVEQAAQECDNMCHDALRRASMSADAEKAQPSRNAAENYAACATKIRALFEQKQTKEGRR